MSFSEFISEFRNFMAQQKQRKQLIFTNDNNIFTYCFQPIQRLQPNFKVDGIRTFMYTKYNKDNAKLRIFSFIPQRQRIQPNFMNYTYQPTKETNANWTSKTTTSTCLSALTQSLCFYNWDNANTVTTEATQILEYLYSNFTINQPISYISSITNLYTSSSPKILYVAWWTNFVHSIHPYMNPLPKKR